MTDAGGHSQMERGVIQHLEEALETEETDEVNYRIRQALQLLGVE